MKDKNGMQHDENNGQFTSGSSKDKSTQAENKRLSELLGEKIPERKKLSAEVLGKEYKGYKGQDAIDKLVKEKQGHIKGAFNHKDIGDIDLIWGDEGSGLYHIINERAKQGGIDISAFLSELTDVIENGKFLGINENGRYEIFKDNKKAIVDVELREGKVTYLFTAYKTRKNTAD